MKNQEGIYEFPLAIGSHKSLVTGRCSLGGQIYEGCIVRFHSHGLSIHSKSGSTLSPIPILTFQSDNKIFCEEYIDKSTKIIEALTEPGEGPHLHIKEMIIRDIYVKYSNEIFDQLLTGPLRVTTNVQQAALKIDQKELKQLRVFAMDENK